jgi:hypothetical protein
VALGLFFGLRSQARLPDAAPPSVAAVAGSPAGSQANPSDPLLAVEPITSRPSERDLTLKLNEQARLSLEKHRRLMIEKCWLPAGGRGQAFYRYLITVNAAGRETKRQIETVLGAESREDVLACLRKLPGTEVSVDPRDTEGTASFDMPFP